MIPIPEELLEQVERGNVLLFIGERLVRDASGEVTLDRLAGQLAARAGLEDPQNYTFPEAAQAYEDEHGRNALVRFLREQLAAVGDEPQPVHRLIAGLAQCNMLVTTTLNRRLERAFAEAQRPLDVVVSDEDVPFEDESRARLYKLRGALDRVDSVILTEEDHERFFEDQASLSVVLQGYLARKTILFVGYDLDDANFKRLYRKVTAPLDDLARRAYAFGESPPLQVARWCKRHGISVVEADAAAFLQALVQQLAARARPAAATRPQAPVPDESLPDQPYKLLDYYEAQDAGIFFGRQQEIHVLSSLMHAHRLTLLYGASGVGKTSLLLAGAVPRLERAEPPYTTIYVRALDDPTHVIRHAVRRRLPDADLPENGALVPFLATAARALGRPLVIVLDQFEEFFIRLSPQFRTAFIAELGALCDATDLPVKVVLSLREDWLAAINELEKRIPQVFSNRMRVLPLTRDQARESITAPVERLGARYEPELVDRLLSDLTGSTGASVMPPQLQLVCSALYGALKPGEQLISLAAYERLGGARGVLQQYLDDELARLPRDERALARAALEDLVTSQGTKAVKTAEEVALALDVDPADLAPVLEKLVRARLLRAIEREDGETAYELAHEYLIREIGLGTEAQARKQAEELIRQEVDNWRRFGTLLAADKLALINDSRAVLRLGPDAQELLLRSALEVGDQIPYWLSRLADPEQRARVLADKARTRVASVRRRTAEVLGTQDVPESVEPLLELALRDSDQVVRETARSSLAKLSGQRSAVMERLQTAVTSQERDERRAALIALVPLPLHGMPARLRLQVRATQARLAARWLVATAPRRAVTLPIAVLLILMLALYTFAASSYYVDTEPQVTVVSYSPNTLQLSNPSAEIVIRQGYPGLPLPGLGQVAIHTGFPVSRLPRSQQEQMIGKQMWGLWIVYGGPPYQKWVIDLVAALYLEDGVPLLWYVDQDEGLKALLGSTQAADFATRRWSAYALGQVAMTKPSAAPQVIAALDRLLADSDLSVRVTTAAALGQVAGGCSHITSQVPKMLSDIMLYNESQYWIDFQFERAMTMMVHTLQSCPNIHVAAQVRQLLNDGNPTVRSHAAMTLEQLADVDVAMATPQMAAALMPLLQDNDSGVRHNTTVALGRIMVVNSSLKTPAAMSSLLSLLNDDDAAKERAAAIAGQLVKANPELATTAVISNMLALLTEYTPSQENVATALGELTNAKPQTISQVLAVLPHVFSGPVWASGAAQADAVEQMVAINPDLASSQTVAALLPLLSATESSVRGNAAAALGHVVRANPNLATSEILTALLPLLNSDKYTHSLASLALGEVAAVDPSHVPPQIVKALYELLNTDSQPALTSLPTTTQLVAERAADILARIYAQQSLQAKTIDNALFERLTNPLDGQDRSIAARALFVIALRDPSLSRTIRTRLDPLAVSSKSITRIWANLTLHLIDLADLAHNSQKTPAERQAVVQDLVRRSSSPIIQGPSRPFFIYDTWAAQQALDWLNKQTKEQRGATP